MAAGAPRAQRRPDPGEGDEHTAARTCTPDVGTSVCVQCSGEDARYAGFGPCALSAGFAALQVKRQASERLERGPRRAPRIGAFPTLHLTPGVLLQCLSANFAKNPPNSRPPYWVERALLPGTSGEDAPLALGRKPASAGLLGRPGVGGEGSGRLS